MEFMEACDGGMWTCLVELNHPGAIIMHDITLEHDICTLECSISLVLAYKCSL
jgi:hypothetical protein